MAHIGHADMAHVGQGLTCFPDVDAARCHAGRVTSHPWRPSLTIVAAVLATALTAGCSDDSSCEGKSYHPDLGQAGAKTPIEALETWLGTATGFGDDLPPDDAWVVSDPDPHNKTVTVIRNDDGDGWWVSVQKTESGGWVVAEATDDATGCADQLSG